MSTRGHITAITGNIISVEVNGPVAQNETGYVLFKGDRLLCEIIRIRGAIAYAQVYESTRGFYAGCEVEFTGKLLSIRLGPGLIGGVYDGLQNDLHARSGTFLHAGEEQKAISKQVMYEFTPSVKGGDRVKAGQALGSVPEGRFVHKILAPLDLKGFWKVDAIASQGPISSDEMAVAKLSQASGEVLSVPLITSWPIRKAIKTYKMKSRPSKVLFTGVRAMDILYPMCIGGTGFIPGPFGCGKTILQQSISKNADADLIIFAACGERANEIAELLHTYAELSDPHTGGKLMERTIIVANTSNMPVAAREASVYTAMTMAEYFRSMGLRVLLLADSTSRWAQALREISNRLEELPGPEAYPMDLPAIISSFYSRAGTVTLEDESEGSITFIGTVSPAGGNMREPVTESTRKVARCYYALSQKRADTKRYPAIDPMESYSRYMDYPELAEYLDQEYYKNWLYDVRSLQAYLLAGREAAEQINILGDDAVPLETHLRFWQGELIDFCLLQQDAFDPVDSLTSPQRQRDMVQLCLKLLESKVAFEGFESMAAFYKKRIYLFKELNYLPIDHPQFEQQKAELLALKPTQNNP